MDIAEKLKKEVIKYQNEIENLLIDYIKIPSVSNSEGVYSALTFAKNLLVKNGYEITGDNKIYTVGKIKGDDLSIGLFSHADVVPVNEGEWTLCKPFEPKIINGCIVGRGSSDNKAGLIVSIYAKKLLEDVGYKLKSTFLSFVGGNEENGMDCIKSFAKENVNPNICFVPDCAFPLSLGEKSILRLKVKSKEKFITVKNFCGGTGVNIVPASASCTIPFLPKKLAEDIVIKKQSKNCKISASGIPMHAAMPFNAKSAIYVLSDFLRTQEGIDENDKRILNNICTVQNDFFLKSLSLNHKSEYFGLDSCVLGTLNTENGYAVFSLDIRFDAKENYQEFENKITDKINSLGFEIIEKEGSEGFVLKREGISESLINAFNYCVKTKEYKPYYSFGGTYSRYLNNAYSIGIVCPPNSKLNLPLGQGNAHQSNEFIPIDGLLNAIVAVSLYIYVADNCLHDKNYKFE